MCSMSLKTWNKQLYRYILTGSFDNLDKLLNMFCIRLTNVSVLFDDITFSLEGVATRAISSHFVTGFLSIKDH